MENLTVTGWIVCVFAVLATGVSKSAFGGALGGLAVPLMTLWLPPGMAVAVMLPILCLMDCFGIRAYWRKWSREDLAVIIPGGLVGIVLGTLVLGTLPDDWVKGAIGLIAVLFMLDRFLGLRARLRASGTPGRKAGWLWSGLSGVTSTLAHAGGPPILVYLMGRGLTKERFVATSTVYFTVINAAKVAPYIALGLFTADTLKLAAILAPLAPLGVWLGLRVLRALPERPFFVIATLLLGASGLKLIVDALA